MVRSQLSSAGRQWTNISSLLHSTNKKKHLLSCKRLGEQIPKDRHQLQQEWGCKQHGLTASMPEFPNISLLILHNSLGTDPPDFPTANLGSSAYVYVSIDSSCFSLAAAQGHRELEKLTPAATIMKLNPTGSSQKEDIK